METNYQRNIRNRNKVHFIIGLMARVNRFIKFNLSARLGRRYKAIVGHNVTMPKQFAKQLNSLVTIGNNVSINHDVNITSLLYPLCIGNNVIIGNNVDFILSTHDIDSVEWEHIQPSGGLVIEDYVWICPHSIILPSVKRIGYGAVIGAGSIVTKDVEPMTVVGGNPARKIRTRKNVHTNVCVESLLGGDFTTYIKTWRNK